MGNHVTVLCDKTTVHIVLDLHDLQAQEPEREGERWIKTT
jgi:hypothetical protein